MSLNLDKSAWKRVALGDVVRHVTDRVDVETSGLERFLAGEHIPSGSLAITDWGVIGRDPIGPMFYKRFKPGDVLYVSRRTYLRKVAVPDFDGITGEKTFVLETLDSNILLQEFLPFVLSAEQFHAYAIVNSRGSVNPYLNWGELAAYDFDLPSLNEQKRIADLLWAVEHHRASLGNMPHALATGYDAWLEAQLRAYPTVPLNEVAELQHGRPVPSSLYGKGNFPLLRPGDMNPDGSVSWSNTSVSIPQEFADQYAGWILNPGDLVTNMTAQSLEDRFLGRVCRMHDQALLNQRIGRLTTGARVTLDFTFVALHSAAFAEWVDRKSEGSKVKHMHWRHIADYPIPVPSPEEQAEIVREAARWGDATNGPVAEYTYLGVFRSSLFADVLRGN